MANLRAIFWASTARFCAYRFVIGVFAIIVVGFSTADRLAAAPLYVTGNTNQILKISEAGSVSTFATLPDTFLYGMAFDDKGNLYTSDRDSNKVYKVTPQASASVFASLALNSKPAGMAIDAGGNLYTANDFAGTVSKIAPAGGVSDFATLTARGPIGLAFNSTGVLFATDFAAHRIARISSNGTTSTFKNLQLTEYPWGLAFDRQDNLYMADSNFNRILKITPTGDSTTFATLPGTSQPTGITFDRSGNLYVAGAGNGVIYKVDSLGVVSPFATGITGPVFLSFPAPVRGDFNQDGTVTAADIPAMLKALTDLSAYQSLHKLSNQELLQTADVNKSGTITNLDIQATLNFIHNLGAGSVATVPEPNGLLLALAGVAVWSVGRKWKKLRWL